MKHSYLEYLQSTFYTPVFLYFSLLTSIIIQVFFRLQTKIHFIITLYTISAFACLLLTDILFFARLTLNPQFNESINVVFANIELLTFLYYFHKIFNSKGFLKFSVICIFVDVVASYYFLTSLNMASSDFRLRSDYVIIFELVTLTVCCLMFYYFLLNYKENKDWLNSPSFWITTGLFFYAIISIPLFIITTRLIETNKDLYRTLFGVHYIFLSILYLFIAKAFVWRKDLLS